jgi:hypothetical protein
VSRSTVGIGKLRDGQFFTWLGLIYDLQTLAASSAGTPDPTNPGFNVGPSFEYVQVQGGGGNGSALSQGWLTLKSGVIFVQKWPETDISSHNLCSGRSIFIVTTSVLELFWAVNV